MAMEQGIAEGVYLFNTQKFFEAHEALEAVWLKSEGRRKTLLHGLIQVAAAFHHHARGNSTGFQSLLKKGCSKLDKFGPAAEGLDIAAFNLALRPWRDRLEHPTQHSLPEPPIPQIKSTQEH